jgi:hypothetical protein
MAIDLATLPQFLTREDAADLLRLTTKSIDTMVSDGKLAKVKLGARRTGITRESMLAHLQRSGLAPSGRDATHAALPHQVAADYQSPHEKVIVNLPGGIDAEWLTMACIATDDWLPKHGIKGATVAGSLSEGVIAVIWNRNLGYSPKKVGRVLMALDRAIGAGVKG